MINRKKTINNARNVDILKMGVLPSNVKYLILLGNDEVNEYRDDYNKINEIADIIFDYNSLLSFNMFNYVVEKALEENRNFLDLDFCIEKCEDFIQNNIQENNYIRT